ncbi:putative adenylate kinase [Helianthus annuus]|nr:putative adenylate kinase [Helianthus annuus]
MSALARLLKPSSISFQWVFLGCPGVGKGTYASRLSNLLGVPHIPLVISSVKSYLPLDPFLIRWLKEDDDRRLGCWMVSGFCG